MKYDIICADPPWDMPGVYGAVPRTSLPGHKHQCGPCYNVMRTSDIKALNINDLAAPDGVLFLWVINSLIRDGLDVLEAWGYHVNGTAVWVKTKLDGSVSNMGLRRPFKASHEIALIGVKNGFTKKMVSMNEPSVVIDKRIHNWERKTSSVPTHSRKTELFYDALERIYPNANKLELFARRDRPGWTCCGNELPALGDRPDKEDIRASIERLSK